MIINKQGHAVPTILFLAVFPDLVTVDVSHVLHVVASGYSVTLLRCPVIFSTPDR